MNQETDEIFYDYLVSIHELAKELKIPTEKFTLDKKLMKIIEKVSKARFRKDRRKIANYEKIARERIEEIKELVI